MAEDGAAEGPSEVLPMETLPGAILFACDHNAIRSPFAEGMMKKKFGQTVFVQSAGVHHDATVDPFMVEVAAELDVDIARHLAKSFDEMESWGDDFGSYDLIVALSPAAQRRALEYTRHSSVEVRYWPTLDPTGIGETRAQKLDAYRQTRDQIAAAIARSFG